MKKLVVSLFIIASLFFLITPAVFAECQTNCGCLDVIKVVPVGSVPNNGEPIVTQSPADLMIFHTGEALGPIKNVWLLIVLNKPTYDNLDEITIDDTTFMTKTDFTLVDTYKIPPLLPKPSTGYPGSLCQYNVVAVKDKMDETGNPIYYAVKSFLSEITTTPTYFTMAVKLTAPADLKALVLALGRLNYYYCQDDLNANCICYKPFNACSSFSKSTFIVPEPATIALITAPFGALGAFGIIAVKRRKK